MSRDSVRKYTPPGDARNDTRGCMLPGAARNYTHECMLPGALFPRDYVCEYMPPGGCPVTVYVSTRHLETFCPQRYT